MGSREWPLLKGPVAKAGPEKWEETSKYMLPWKLKSLFYPTSNEAGNVLEAEEISGCCSYLT